MEVTLEVKCATSLLGVFERFNPYSNGSYSGSSYVIGALCAYEDGFNPYSNGSYSGSLCRIQNSI